MKNDHTPPRPVDAVRVYGGYSDHRLLDGKTRIDLRAQADWLPALECVVVSHVVGDAAALGHSQRTRDAVSELASLLAVYLADVPSPDTGGPVVGLHAPSLRDAVDLAVERIRALEDAFDQFFRDHLRDEAAQ